jgi:hypothetical protein
MMDSTQSLEKLWNWAKEKLTQQELINNFLLAKDNRKKTTWHVAAKWGETESLQNIWEWAKVELSTEQLKNGLLLATDEFAEKDCLAEAELSVNERFSSGYFGKHAAFLEAAWRGEIEILQELWEWGKETLTTYELRDKLLLGKENEGKTAWQFATMEGKVEALEKLWEWGKETLIKEDLKNKLLLAKDNDDKTAWHFAATGVQVEALKKLWEWGKETLTAEEVMINCYWPKTMRVKQLGMWQHVKAT